MWSFPHRARPRTDEGVVQAQAALDAAQATLDAAIIAAKGRREKAVAGARAKKLRDGRGETEGKGTGRHELVNPLGLDDRTMEILERINNSSRVALAADRGTQQPQPQQGHV